MNFSDKAEIKNYLLWLNFRLSCVYVEHICKEDTPLLHQHLDFYELVVVGRGSAIHVVDGNEAKITAGSVLLLSPGEMHTYKEVNHLAIYNVLFGRNFMSYFQPDLTCLEGFQLLFKLNSNYTLKNSSGIKIEDEFLLQIISLLDDMIRVQKNNEPGGQTALLSDFLKVVLLLSRYARLFSNSNKISHIQQLSKLLATLEQKFDEEWPIEKMAKFTNMSYSNFRHEFKLLTNRAPTNYLLSMRLEKAAILLHLPEKRVTEVALRCGFNDLNYFTRQFKKKYGINPSSVG